MISFEMLFCFGKQVVKTSYRNVETSNREIVIMVTMPPPVAKHAVPWSRTRQISTASMETKEQTARTSHQQCVTSQLISVVKLVSDISHKVKPLTQVNLYKPLQLLQIDQFVQMHVSQIWTITTGSVHTMTNKNISVSSDCWCKQTNYFFRFL